MNNVDRLTMHDGYDDTTGGVKKTRIRPDPNPNNVNRVGFNRVYWATRITRNMYRVGFRVYKISLNRVWVNPINPLKPIINNMLLLLVLYNTI